MTRVLAVVATPGGDDSPAAEFFRVLAALRAVGHEVALVETGAGVGTLAAARADGPDDVVRTLEALAQEGVVEGEEPDLAAAIARADALLVLGDPARPAMPPVLRLRRGEAPPKGSLTALTQAGQVVLE